MKYRNLGGSGLKVSEIALGSWMTDLRDAQAQKTAEETVDLAFENGINFFDCADAYSGGEAERFLGKILQKHSRNEYVISSKVFFPVGPGANDWGLSRKHITENIHRTLTNLSLDYIDIYYCHRFDGTTPMEETLRTLSSLVDQGKILYYGVSEEWSAARLQEAEGIIMKYGLHPLSSVQPQYNMIDRYIEHEIVDVCKKYGIGITPFSPLAQGLLTGKYKKGQPYPEGSRAVTQADHQVNALLTDENLDKVEKLSAIAQRLGTTMPCLALAWILKQPMISCVIAGASRSSQLAANLSAVDLVIPDDVMKEINEILAFSRFERHVG